MNKSLKIIIPVAIGIVILLAVVVFTATNNDTTIDESVQSGPVGDATDAMRVFFDEWLTALNDGSIDAVLPNLVNDTRITGDVQRYIVSELGDAENATDPVFCQPVIPERYGTKISFEDTEKAQILVFARGLDEKSSSISVVDLVVVDNKWQIANITCSEGESAPDREFSFDKEGFLLKSVPPPLNPEYWHVVFEENGQMGHTAPLFFSPESICVSRDGLEEICNQDSFMDATKVTVKGEMIESGVNVRRVQFE